MRIIEKSSHKSDLRHDPVLIGLSEWLLTMYQRMFTLNCKIDRLRFPPPKWESAETKLQQPTKQNITLEDLGL